MNCSLMVNGMVIIGCRERKVYVFSSTLQMQKVIDVPESVHCLCAMNQQQVVCVGMTEGHVMLLDVTGDDIKIQVAARFKEIGGIWCI